MPAAPERKIIKNSQKDIKPKARDKTNKPTHRRKQQYDGYQKGRGVQRG